MKSAVSPTDILLVVDAMTGQEAANLVKSFNEAIEITGAVLTKMDGDSRGGAALSIFEVSGKPIKFVGTGEKMESLEPFYPDRMAGRILGMGDMLTLYEKAEGAIKVYLTIALLYLRRNMPHLFSACLVDLNCIFSLSWRVVTHIYEFAEHLLLQEMLQKRRASVHHLSRLSIIVFTAGRRSS